VLFRKDMLLGRGLRFQGEFADSLSHLERAQKAAEQHKDLIFDEDLRDLTCDLADTLRKLDGRLFSLLSSLDKDLTCALMKMESILVGPASIQTVSGRLSRESGSGFLESATAVVSRRQLIIGAASMSLSIRSAGGGVKTAKKLTSRRLSRLLQFD
jgi:hypothetical protein